MRQKIDETRDSSLAHTRNFQRHRRLLITKLFGTVRPKNEQFFCDSPLCLKIFAPDRWAVPTLRCYQFVFVLQEVERRDSTCSSATLNVNDGNQLPSSHQRNISPSLAATSPSCGVSADVVGYRKLSRHLKYRSKGADITLKSNVLKCIRNDVYRKNV